jgi:hypothetical protein
VGIVNRRNAVLGWAAWQVGKRIARRKAQAAVPKIDARTKRPNAAAIVTAVAAALTAVGGVIWFWRTRGSEADGEPTES